MVSKTLNNEVEMPMVGLGTFQITGDEAEQALVNAISVGYTMFDSAAAYHNSEILGSVLKKNFKNRSEYFLTTKLRNCDQRKGDVREALTSTLRFLNIDYVDLYLMHWPNPGTYIDCYKQMEVLYKEGLARAIGVCNFHEHHLENLMQHTEIVPAVNQFELHPLLSQKKLVQYCKERNIAITAYTPFARMHEKLIENPILKEIAACHNKKVTQIIMRWNLQNDIIAIPKSSKLENQRDNINIFDFELSEAEMKAIDGINENFRVRHDPDNCDFNHL